MAQSQDKKSAQGGKAGSGKHRTAWLMVFFFLCAAGLAAGISWWLLDNSRKLMAQEMENRLDSEAGNKVALLTVWSGTLREQLENFANLDLMRLFATEVYVSGVPAEKLLDLSLHPSQNLPGPEESRSSPMVDLPVVSPEYGESGHEKPEQTENASNESLANLALKLPLMLTQLREFVEKHNFRSICLVNASAQTYLSPGKAREFDEDQKKFIEAVFASGQPAIFPVRRLDGDLVVDAAYPIVAPTYIDPTGKRIVSVLLATYSVLPVARNSSGRTESGCFNSAIIQYHGKQLELVSPAVRTGILPLEGWTLEDGSLPLARREVPTLDGRIMPAQTMARKVPGMPWLVMQGLDEESASAEFRELLHRVLVADGVALLFVLIVLVALWWRLVGREERAQAAQMRRLYLVVNQQKQIMDGVNSALSAGIVLTDLNAVIFYTNQSYAKMAGMDANKMRGMKYGSLPPDLARSLSTHVQAVQQSRTLLSFTEDLPVDGKIAHFMTTCSPFWDDKQRLAGVVSVYSDITEIIRAQRQATHMVTQTVSAFVRAIEAADPYLCGQSAFTAELSVTLAHCLGLGSNDIVETLRTAASLSQIGMIQMPRELISKSGVLTAAERAQLQNHVNFARDALTGIDFGLPILDAITQMYERLDGSGYPQKLKGDAICIHARILAVANTFCALMRPRSYRVALGVDRAIRILSETPFKYDQDVVNALQSFLQTAQGKSFLAKLQQARPGQPGAREGNQAGEQAKA